MGKESSYGIITGTQLEYFYLNLETYRTIYDVAISYEAKVDSVLKIELSFGSLLDLRICS